MTRLGLLCAISALPLSIGGRAIGASVMEPPEEALSFAPPGTIFIGFSDWSRMKAACGLETLDGSTPAELRLDALHRIMIEEAPFARFGADSLVGHVETWGWDTSDLEREAMIIGDGAPVHVLDLREGFDVDAVRRRLDERDFPSTRSSDIIICSHAFDPSTDWFATTDLGIQNVAFIDDGAMLVLSGQAAPLEAVLKAWRRAQSTGGPGGRSAQIAAALFGTSSAAVDFFAASCRSHDPPSGARASTGVAESIEAVGPLRSWQFMALGTFRPGDQNPFARLIFAFSRPDPATLAQERTSRERIAQAVTADQEGPFELVGSAVDGSLVRLDLKAVDAPVGRFRDLLFRGELAPAMYG